MSIQLKIRIIKEIINQSKNCGVESDIHETGRNCAIAVALQDIFHEVYVTNYYIFPFGIDNTATTDLKITLPVIAQQFIKLFDGFRVTPNLRLLLPEFEFTIDIPPEVINAINIDEVKELTGNRKSRSVIHAV